MLYEISFKTIYYWKIAWYYYNNHLNIIMEIKKIYRSYKDQYMIKKSLLMLGLFINFIRME